jgi:predicted transcriptional regulator
MRKVSSPKPTEAELAILRVLWRRGPSTVRQVLEEVDRPQTTGYTTVLKLMQIMTEKGLLKREASGRLHVYEAALSEHQTQQQLVRHLLDRAFGGSVQRLVMQALAVKRASPEELAHIRRLLDEWEGTTK